MNTISISSGLRYPVAGGVAEVQDRTKTPVRPADVVSAPSSLHHLWIRKSDPVRLERLLLALVATTAIGSLGYGVSLIPSLLRGWPSIETALNRLIQ